ncbi:nuclear transport factor 2 family protein [Mycobacterium colombiense]|uniref:nuclear transport factor 2 family protein n=1 Tax=Mycobacterium colombiense TaxID=339268 RepID=UPI0009E2975B|nr:nuclear transport factor 2 family protein [Mycobacterium colombiense]
MTTNDLRSVADERAIERALVQLARAMDDRDWATLEDIIADDAIGDLGNGRVEGRAAIIDLIRGYLDRCGPTQHLLGNVLVDVTGEAAVSAAPLLLPRAPGATILVHPEPSSQSPDIGGPLKCQSDQDRSHQHDRAPCRRRPRC